MTEILPFPFDKLENLTRDELAVQGKVRALYEMSADSPDLLNRLMEPISSLLRVDLKTELVKVQVLTSEEMIQSFGQSLVLTHFSVEPVGKSALLAFDPVLAKVLSIRILSDTDVTEDDVLAFDFKPITALEEGVVQYATVLLLERVREILGTSRLKFNFDSLHRDATILKNLLTTAQQNIVFTVRLTLLRRDYYVRLILPMAICDHLGWTKSNDRSESERLKQMGRFDCEILLNVAQVQLEPKQLEELADGDILLFDHATVDLQDGRLIGRARLNLTETESDQGYWASLEIRKDAILARLEDVF